MTRAKNSTSHLSLVPNVIDGPWKTVRGKDHSYTAKALRELADTIDGDASVRGAIIIIDRDGDDPEYIATSRFAREKARIVVALHRIAYWIIHDD